MFDFHLHSRVSPDSKAEPADMIVAAKNAGLREICFTDHMDCEQRPDEALMFTQEDYEREYGDLRTDGLTVRFGMEYGMTPDNRECFRKEIAKREYDFIIGSLHTVDDCNIYKEVYWKGKTQEQVYTHYFEVLLECLKVHRDFHVLGHLTHPTKAAGNPGHAPYTMERYGDLAETVV